MSRLIIPGSETLEPAGSQLACVAGGISCASAFVLKGLVKSLVAASPLANSSRALPAHKSRQLRRLVHRCRSYPSFCSIKRLGVFPLPLDGMLVHRRALSCNLFGFPSYHTLGWRKGHLAGLEPRPLALGTRPLAMGPPRLSHNPGLNLKEWKIVSSLWQGPNSYRLTSLARENH